MTMTCPDTHTECDCKHVKSSCLINATAPDKHVKLKKRRMCRNDASVVCDKTPEICRVGECTVTQAMGKLKPIQDDMGRVRCPIGGGLCGCSMPKAECVIQAYQRDTPHVIFKAQPGDIVDVRFGDTMLRATVEMCAIDVDSRLYKVQWFGNDVIQERWVSEQYVTVKKAFKHGT